MKKYIFLSFLIFSVSSFSSDNESVEDKHHLISSIKPSEDNVFPEDKIQNIKSDLLGIDFNTMLNAWKDRKLIKLGGKEYIVLQNLPKLETYNIGKFVRANPCYTNSLGPYLLKEKDLENLPKSEHKITWFIHKFDMVKFKDNIFITVRYTANNNPHWEHKYKYEKPFDNWNNHYWHTEANMQSVSPIRTVNFILQKVKSSF